MKIGIITIINVNNYGAELQAFALHHKLKLMGYENEIINYLYYKNSRFKFEKESAPVFNISIKNRLKDSILLLIDKYSAFRYPKIAKLRKFRFDEFHRKHTSLTKPFKSFSELYNSNLNYDTYIVGSDQVWNPNNGTSLEPYFLTFAPIDSRKISYASSFGIKSIPNKYFPQYKKWLNNLNFISTRESDGVNIIKEISGINAKHVVDPTLLLSKSDWENFLIPFESNEPYILFFVFKKNSFAEDLAFKIKKKTGYKIIRVCKNEMAVESDNKILNVRDFGPAEFLGLYQKASFVITTSFHGSIFSLIFEKPFFTVTPNSKDNNSRQESLMSMVGLNHRLIKEGSEVDLDSMFDIKFDSIRVCLNEQIIFSELYLKSSLSSRNY